MHTFTVATYNVHHRRTDHAILADVLKLIHHGADVICLQEMGGHQGIFSFLPNGWHAQVGTPGRGAGRADTPIAYNSLVVSPVRSGARHVSNPTKVEEGAGGSTVPEKTVTWVTLQHRRAKRDVVVLNTHALPSVEANGQPSPHHPRRLRLFADLMRVLTDMLVRRPGRLVVVCGDLNVDYRDDSRVKDARFPYRVFEKAGVEASYKRLGEPTGQRLIDYVAHRQDARLVPQHQKLLDGYGSDHKPLMVTYALN